MSKIWYNERGLIVGKQGVIVCDVCPCTPCPLTAGTKFLSVQIFGNAATKYTDATVPNLPDGTNFLSTMGASLTNEVWYYDDGAGKTYWFFIRPANGFGCGNTPMFDTYGYDENRFGPGTGGNLNNETYCCEDTYNQEDASYAGMGVDTTWTAFR
jgi:hypothetical protein